MGSRAIVIAPRTGPAPACSDGELLAIAVAGHLLGRRSEAGFLAEVALDWSRLFPRLPHQSEASRRIRWLRGAFEQLRAMLAARLPEGDYQQIDTSALPARHTSRSAAGISGPGWTTTWPPGSAATPPTLSGSTASGWPSRPISARGSSGPGASCPPR